MNEQIGAEATESKPIRVLSVEDNAADMRLISELLGMSTLKTQVDFVRDGSEALDFLFQRGKYQDAPRPQLILLDLTLPKVDGHEVLQTVKESPDLKSIPVLILSGSRSRSDVNRSYTNHANTYIVKPLDLDELTEVVHGIEQYWNRIAQLPYEDGPGSTPERTKRKAKG